MIKSNNADAQRPNLEKKSFIDSTRASSNLNKAISLFTGSLQINAPAAPTNIKKPIN